MQCITEAYSEPCQTSKRAFRETSLLDVWQGSEYASVQLLQKI